jgi:hypothetical protein
MKKVFSFILALALCTGNAMAFEFENEPESGFSFMGIFGMNVSKLQNSGYSAKAGAMLGAKADYMLPHAHGTYITAGLDWTMKGGRRTDILEMVDFVPYESSRKYALHYIEIPIRVGFRYNLSEDLGFYGEFGPYFAVGVGGRHKCNIDGDGPNIRTREDELDFNAFKNNEYDATYPHRLPFQRWDSGISFRIGAEYANHYNLMIGCDWGLADIYRTNLRDTYAKAHPNGERLPKVKNFNFSITIGYRL